MTIALASKWRAERRIVRLAYFDTLTGLPNREQSRNRLVGALQAAKENSRTLAVLYLDLDNFKRVNDTLGHAVGDELLCVVADRLRSSLRYGNDSDAGQAGSSRSGDIARLGGDEFLVLLPSLRTSVDAGNVAERLITGAARADAARLQLARRHPERRHRALSAGRHRRRDPAAQRRPGDVLRQAPRARHLRLFRRLHERHRAAPLHHRGAAARRAGAQRVHAAVPAAVRRAHRRASPASRRCCAGPMPSWARSVRPSSSRWPRRPA